MIAPTIMHSRIRPSSINFLAFAVDAFSDLPLKVETVVTPMVYASEFKSRCITFDVYFEFRDAVVGCSISELRNVATGNEVELTPHCDPLLFLIENAGYRGSLSEFRPKGAKLTYWEADVLMYSAAMRHFFKGEIQANA